MNCIDTLNKIEFEGYKKEKGRKLLTKSAL